MALVLFLLYWIARWSTAALGSQIADAYHWEGHQKGYLVDAVGESNYQYDLRQLVGEHDDKGAFFKCIAVL